MDFDSFYQFYLSEHKNVVNRRLHFFGSILSLGFLISFICYSRFKFIPLAVVTGYAPAWIGHFFFEKNKPASFKHPIMSFMCDWVMVKDIFLGKVSLRK